MLGGDPPVGTSALVRGLGVMWPEAKGVNSWQNQSVALHTVDQGAQPGDTQPPWVGNFEAEEGGRTGSQYHRRHL